MFPAIPPVILTVTEVLALVTVPSILEGEGSVPEKTETETALPVTVSPNCSLSEKLITRGIVSAAVLLGY
jgi:hypothetical protein